MKEDDEKIIAKAAKMYVRQVQLGWLKVAIFLPIVLGYLGYQHWIAKPQADHEVAYINLGSTYDRSTIQQLIQAELAKDRVRAVIVVMPPHSDQPMLQMVNRQDKDVFLVVNANGY